MNKELFSGIILRQELKPGLYIVPTPIGNIDDITIRAVQVLANADIIACEDTRHTGQLLSIIGIKPKKLESYHDYNEKPKAVYLINEIKNNKSVALASDAGMPGISDPAYRIVSEAIKENIAIIPLPGASAVLPALVASGLAIHNFSFFGFPPQKKGRKKFLEIVSNHELTSIIYESPFKVERLIDELIELCGEDRQACIARELTKIYEEFFRGTLLECKIFLSNKDKIKGEFVVVLESKK